MTLGEKAVGIELILWYPFCFVLKGGRGESLTRDSVRHGHTRNQGFRAWGRDAVGTADEGLLKPDSEWVENPV